MSEKPMKQDDEEKIRNDLIKAQLKRFDARAEIVREELQQTTTLATKNILNAIDNLGIQAALDRDDFENVHTILYCAIRDCRLSVSDVLAIVSGPKCPVSIEQLNSNQILEIMNYISGYIQQKSNNGVIIFEIPNFMGLYELMGDLGLSGESFLQFRGGIDTPRAGLFVLKQIRLRMKRGEFLNKTI